MRDLARAPGARALPERRKRIKRRRLREAVPRHHADSKRGETRVGPRRDRRASDEYPLETLNAVLLALRREDVRKRRNEEREVDPEAVHGVVYAPEVRAHPKRHAVDQHEVRRGYAEDVVERKKHQRALARAHRKRLRARSRERLDRGERKLRSARNRCRAAGEDYRGDGRRAVRADPRRAAAFPEGERLLRVPALHENVRGKRPEPHAQHARHAPRHFDRLLAV